MDRDMLVMLVAFGGLICGVLLGAYAGANLACDQRAQSFESHEYGVFSGCMVLHRGRWLPLENIRGFDDKG